MPNDSEKKFLGQAAAEKLISNTKDALDGKQPKGNYASKQDVDSKLDADKLPEAINTALAQAKASGEFDGKDGTSVTVKSVSESADDDGTNVVTFSDGKQLNVKNGRMGNTGQRGTGLIAITTTPTAYTTEVNGLTPAYRVALSTVKSQGGVTEVKVGDVVQRSYYHYPVIYVDSSYVYTRARVSIRGATGDAYTLTDADKATITDAVIAALPVYNGEVV